MSKHLWAITMALDGQFVSPFTFARRSRFIGLPVPGVLAWSAIDMSTGGSG